MKVVYFTDPHLTPARPRARRDNFAQVMLTKLAEVVDTVLAFRERGERAILVCGGDLFHNPVIPVSYFREVVRILRRLGDTPMFIAPGNHDIFAYNLETTPRTMLGLLEASGLVVFLTRTPMVFTDGSHKVFLTGVEYYSDIDKTPGDYCVDRPSEHNETTIHVVHGYLVNYPIDYVGHTYIKDVTTHADFVLTGHEHTGFGIVEYRGTVFCNPGAAGRVNASETEIARTPRFAVINTATKSITMAEFKAAKPGSQVLDRREIERAKIQQTKIEEFTKSIENTVGDEAIDLDDCVEHISKLEKVPKNIRDKAVEYVSAAQERIMGSKLSTEERVVTVEEDKEHTPV